MRKSIVLMMLVAILYGEDGIMENEQVSDRNKTYQMSDIEGTWEKNIEHKQSGHFIVKAKIITTYQINGNYSSKDVYEYYDLHKTFIAAYNNVIIGKWSISKTIGLRITPKRCNSKLIEKNSNAEIIFKEVDMINKMMCMFNIPVSSQIIDISSDKIITKEGTSIRIK